jgi:hypothetical protein
LINTRERKLQKIWHTQIGKMALSASLLTVLAACGGSGGSSGAGSNNSAGTGSITLSGQVVDSAISGAQVCLFSNGAQARNAAGGAICSSLTDAQGNYTLTIPKSLASGLLTLVATKGSDIKLTSSLGTLDQVLSAAGVAGTVTPSDLPSATVTHITTADFALADTNHDGTVSQAELDAYKPDPTKVQKAASIIKAYIDGGQTSLIGGQTADTLALASAVVQNKPLGSTGQTVDDWLNGPANAQVSAIFTEVDQALTAALNKEMAGKFSKYKLTDTVTQQTVPPVVTANGGAASIYCSTDRTLNVPLTTDIDIAFDAARSIALVRYTNNEGKPEYMKGSYNPKTGDFTLHEIDPKRVVQPGTVTFYGDGYVKYEGKIDAAGNITGTFEDSSSTTWTLDATRQTCVDKGSFTITKQ